MTVLLDEDGLNRRLEPERREYYMLQETAKLEQRSTTMELVHTTGLHIAQVITTNSPS